MKFSDWAGHWKRGWRDTCFWIIQEAWSYLPDLTWISNPKFRGKKTHLAIYQKWYSALGKMLKILKLKLYSRYNSPSDGENVRYLEGGKSQNKQLLCWASMPHTLHSGQSKKTPWSPLVQHVSTLQGHLWTLLSGECFQGWGWTSTVLCPLGRILVPPHYRKPFCFMTHILNQYFNKKTFEKYLLNLWYKSPYPPFFWCPLYTHTYSMT